MAFPSRGRLLLSPLLLLLLAILSVASDGRHAGAHAFLASSDPAANAILPDTPAQVRMRFTEPLERVASTRALLFDQQGRQVPGTSIAFDDQDRHVMRLILPDMLPAGTYSAVWQTLSAADGHPARGYIPFTIGTAADVRSVVPPDLGEDAGAPDWLQVAGRWLGYVGLAIVVGVWPVWLLVLRPAISPAWQAGPRLVRRVRRLAYIGLLLALAGSLIALMVQVENARGNEDLFSTLRSTLDDTRFGRMWLFRLALLLAAGVGMASVAWWWPRRQRATTLALLGISALLPFPFALMSHASAQTVGRASTIAVDMLHLTAGSVWAGGIAVLVAGLGPTLRDLTPAGRAVVLRRAIPRFSAVSLAAWSIILLTGFYAGWLQVGGLRPLRDTAYGTSLTVKLLLVVPLLAAAAFNLLLVSRQVRRRYDEAIPFNRRFLIAIGLELVLAVAVLGVTSRLTMQAPARESYAQEANQVDLIFDLQGRPASLSLAPGKPGPNHFRLDVGGDPLPADTEALLRLTAPMAGAGVAEVKLDRVSGNGFELHGSEISVAGTWKIEVIVRQIGGFQWVSTITLPIESAAASSLPGPAWKFRSSALLGFALAVLGIAALPFGWWRGRGPLRKESLGLGTVAVALGALVLLQARISTASGTIPLDTPNPIPADAASIERGRTTYEAYCLVCHGANGKGDGPAASAYTPLPADFSTQHAMLHLDAEFFNWIKNGKPPTDMPAFGDQLSDDEIWDVINYVRALGRAGAAATPSPAP